MVTVPKSTPSSVLATFPPSATNTAYPSHTPSPTHSPTPSLTPTTRKLSRTPKPTPTLPAVHEVNCHPQDGECVSAVVVSVIDGDTIQVSIRGLTYIVRYLGIDMPETRNPVERMGSEAAARNAELVKTKRVTLVRDPADEDTDSYGRFLRYVIVEDTFVDYQLVREGLAFLFLSDDTCSPDLFAAYETAQKDKAGIFAPTPKPEN